MQVERKFMKQSEVEVFPYVGVNDYKFGKTPSEIEKEFGAPQKREEDDILEMVIEDRDGMEFEYHKKGKKYLLSAITILQKNCKNIYYLAYIIHLDHVKIFRIRQPILVYYSHILQILDL